ncbi:tight adherence pilus pseudopilin TadF [Vibrio paucivorans]
MRSKSISKQRGTFVLEFAIMGFVLCLLFAFGADIVTKMSYKGKLDRLSYSLVNVLKERTQLYEKEVYDVTSAEANSITRIAKSSLTRMAGNAASSKVGVVVESLTFSDIGESGEHRTYGSGCEIGGGDLEDLSVVTTWDRQASVYRVTVCYDTPNIFGSLLGQNYSEVSSSSVMLGR